MQGQAASTLTLTLTQIKGKLEELMDTELSDDVIPQVLRSPMISDVSQSAIYAAMNFQPTTMPSCTCTTIPTLPLCQHATLPCHHIPPYTTTVYHHATISCYLMKLCLYIKLTEADPFSLYHAIHTWNATPDLAACAVCDGNGGEQKARGPHRHRNGANSG